MKIGIVGLGTMGLGIAQVLAAAGCDVAATDAEAAARDAAKGRIAAELDRRVAAGRMAEAERAAAFGRVSVMAGSAGLARSDLVIEAIVEDLGAKRALFASLEEVVRPETVLATNTSSLSVAQVAGGLRRPERVIGLHFFNPAPVMTLVELIPHAGTSKEALALGRRIAEMAGKAVIDAPDRPGFVVNRCARPFYGEALALLEEGRAPPEIDAAMVAAGYRMGPFAIIDLVGADVHLAATRVVAEAMQRHPRYHVFGVLERQVASGALGRKAGRGFAAPPAPGQAPADARLIVERIEATLINEAGWLLAEGGATAEGINAAMRRGLGFPRGPFEILASHGVAAVRAVLATLEASAPAHLKGRYAPAPILEVG